MARMAPGPNTDRQNPQPKKVPSKEEEFRVKVSTDTKSALRSLSDLERKVEKLSNLGDRGDFVQNGFLSKKQVKMYQDITKEIETIYQKHYNRLLSIQKEYEGKKNSAQQEVDKRQKQYSEAQLRGSNPKVVDFYHTKLNEAKKNVQYYESSNDVTAQISVLQSQIDKLNAQRKEGQRQGGRIGQMHEQSTTSRDLTNGAIGALASTGMILSLSSLWGYAQSGKYQLRHEEYRGARVGQKIGYDGGNDADMRLRAIQTGEKNQYNAYDTEVVQSTLIRGGSSGKTGVLAKDTEAVQRFGRAYAVDPNEVAYQGTQLEKVGALKEGDMNRFAKIMADAIAKRGMQGREEELMRTTTSLLTTVSNRMTSMTNGQVGSVTQLETAINNAAPGLKGDQGGQLLSRIDSALKSGDNNLDVLMGRGTNPQFTGLEGYYNLKYMQEEGLANPLNLQYAVQGAQKFGSVNPKYQSMIRSQALNLSLHEDETLDKAGIYDQVMNGNFNVSDAQLKALEDSGNKDLADKIRQWNKTNSKDIEYNQARGDDLKSSVGKVPSRIGQYGNGLFQSLPVPVKAGLIGVSGLAGTLGIRSLSGSLSKGLGSLLKKFTPNIAESEAGATTFSKMFGTFSKSGVASKALGALAPIGAGIGIYNTSKNMVGSIKDLYSSFSDHDNYYTSDAYKNKLLQGEERRQHPIKSLFGVTDYSKLSADDFQEKWNALSSSSNFGHTPGQQDYIKALKNLQEKEQSKYEEVDKVLSTAEKNHTVNIVVSGKVDGMDETNQETVGKSISDYFASLFGVHPSTNGINLSVDQKFK